MGASTKRKPIRRTSRRHTTKEREGAVRVFVGGTFDGLHSGHLYLLTFARECGAAIAKKTQREGVHVTVVVARDESVLRIKHRQPHHTQQERQALLSALRTVDQAIVGVPNDFIRSVRRVDPDIIVLGYDQKASWEGALRDAGIHAGIMRCPAYESGRLKSSKLRSELTSMTT